MRYASLTRLLGVKVEIYQLSTLPTSFLWTSSPPSSGPLAPSSSLEGNIKELPKDKISLGHSDQCLDKAVTRVAKPFAQAILNLVLRAAVFPTKIL